MDDGKVGNSIADLLQDVFDDFAVFLLRTEHHDVGLFLSPDAGRWGYTANNTSYSGCFDTVFRVSQKFSGLLYFLLDTTAPK